MKTITEIGRLARSIERRVKRLERGAPKLSIVPAIRDAAEKPDLCPMCDSQIINGPTGRRRVICADPDCGRLYHQLYRSKS